MKYCKVEMGSILAVVLCLLSLYGISEDVKNRSLIAETYESMIILVRPEGC